MSKLFLLLVIAVFAISTNVEGFGNFGFPNAGLFQFGFPGFPMPPMKMLTPDDIKNMKPKDGNTVVNGASVYSSSSMDTVNGVPVRKVSRGRIVTNDNGKVTDTRYGD